MKKVGVFGCKSTTIFLIESLKKITEISCVITISPDNGKRNQVADYTDIKRYCQREGINCYVSNSYELKDKDDIKAIESMQLDIGFVVGWQRLIPKEILQNFSVGVFGMHGSTDDLPIGRGRSPLNWALIEQRKHFFTNLFKYDAGVDSGDVLDTFIFSIQPYDTAETLHYKNVLAMKTLILRNLNNLKSGNYNLKKQQDIDATYYPKRTPEDGLIDWNKDIYQLESFIRAVTKPFDGAFSYYGKKKFIIWRASIFETNLVDFGYRDQPNGKVVEVYPSGKHLIKCRGGILIVHDFETIVKLKKGMKLESPINEIKKFRLNNYGYHDLKRI